VWFLYDFKISVVLYDFKISVVLYNFKISVVLYDLHKSLSKKVVCCLNNVKYKLVCY